MLPNPISMMHSGAFFGVGGGKKADFFCLVVVVLFLLCDGVIYCVNMCAAFSMDGGGGAPEMKVVGVQQRSSRCRTVLVSHSRGEQQRPVTGVSQLL